MRCCVYLIDEILSVTFVVPHLQQPLSSTIQTILSHITSSSMHIFYPEISALWLIKIFVESKYYRT